MSKSFKYIISIITTIAIGALGTLFTDSITTWYTTLEKPFFNPPNWVFGPAWTLLFILIGISFAIVWQKKGKLSLTFPFLIYPVQMLFNVLWSYTFFGLQSPALALVDIGILWILIIINIKIYYPISKAAAYLLIPYLAWVTFATSLNASILYLN